MLPSVRVAIAIVGFLLSGCVLERPLFYMADIRIDADEQVCFSIPSGKSWHKGISYRLWMSRIFSHDTASRVWASSYYGNNAFRVKAGECLPFDYTFHEGRYSISFTTTESDEASECQGERIPLQSRKEWYRDFTLSRNE